MGTNSIKILLEILPPRPRIDNKKIKQMLENKEVTLEEALAHKKDKHYYNLLRNAKIQHDKKHKKDDYER